MAKRDDAVNALVVAALVAACVGLVYHFLKPRPQVRRGDGSGLVERVDPTADRSRRSLIQVVDGVNFDLDSFDVGEEYKKMLVAHTRFAEVTRAAADAYELMVDDYRADMNAHFKRWSKAVFYESKGEYKKAIMILVEMSKGDYRSPRFKHQIYLKLAHLLDIAGDHRQSLKAMLRAVETLEKANPSDPAALKAERVRILKELNALGGS